MCVSMGNDDTGTFTGVCVYGIKLIGELSEEFEPTIAVGRIGVIAALCADDVATAAATAAKLAAVNAAEEVDTVVATVVCIGGAEGRVMEFNTTLALLVESKAIC